MGRHKLVYLVNDDTGMYDTEKNNAISNNNMGYLVAPEGKESKNTSYVTEFASLGRYLINGNADDKTTLDKTGAKYEAVGTGLGAYGYVVTDYGIHLMFVNYIPYDESQIADEICKDTNTLPLDYIVYYGRYNDENDKSKTLEEAIFDAMKSAFISQEYTRLAQEAINANKDSISTNDKLWKKKMKDLNEYYSYK